MKLDLKDLKKKYSSYKSNAKQKNREFKLSFKQFKNLCSQECYYCKVSPKDEVIGVDRYFNHRGYYIGNCVPSCCNCNRSKSNMNPADFDDYIARIKNDEPEYIKIERKVRNGEIKKHCVSEMLRINLTVTKNHDNIN